MGSGTGYLIRQVWDPEEKEGIAAEVLVALPEWFGLPESRSDYIEKSRGMPFWAAFSGERALGFAALKETGPAAAEVFVMGVLPEYHRMGIGKGLYEALERWARERGYAFVQVKTVQMGRYSCYDRTNRFYRSMGFQELECFPTLWDEWNPCQVYVKYIGAGAGRAAPGL